MRHDWAETDPDDEGMRWRCSWCGIYTHSRPDSTCFGPCIPEYKEQPVDISAIAFDVIKALEDRKCKHPDAKGGTVGGVACLAGGIVARILCPFCIGEAVKEVIGKLPPLTPDSAPQVPLQADPQPFQQGLSAAESSIAASLNYGSEKVRAAVRMIESPHERTTVAVRVAAAAFLTEVFREDDETRQSMGEGKWDCAKRGHVPWDDTDRCRICGEPMTVLKQEQ